MISQGSYVKNTIGDVEIYSSLEKRDSLIIFLSPAANDQTNFVDFLTYLEGKFDVIYVDGGYYGLCKNKNYNDKEFDSDDFVSVFYEFLKNKLNDYRQIFLLGASIGTIQILKLQSRIPNAKIILVSPPMSEYSFRFETFGRFFFKFFLKTRLGHRVILPNNLFQKTVYLFLSLFSVPIANSFERVGYDSFVHALDEIMRFGVIDPKLFPEDWIVFIGRHDVFLGNFCCQSYLRSRKNTFLLDTGHTILQHHWLPVVNKIEELMKK